jgi:hypothetical protein
MLIHLHHLALPRLSSAIRPKRNDLLITAEDSQESISVRKADPGRRRFEQFAKFP